MVLKCLSQWQVLTPRSSHLLVKKVAVTYYYRLTMYSVSE